MTLSYRGYIRGDEIMTDLDPDRSSGNVFIGRDSSEKYISTLGNVRNKIPDISSLDIPDETKVLVYGDCVLLLDNEPLYSMDYCDCKEILALRVISELSIYTWGKSVLEPTTGDHYQYVRGNNKFSCIHEPDSGVIITHTNSSDKKLREFNSNSFDTLDEFFETFMEYINECCWIDYYSNSPSNNCYKVSIPTFDEMWDSRIKSVVAKINGEYQTFI